MQTKTIFLGANNIGVGEDISVPSSIPTESLQKGVLMRFPKSVVIPFDFTSIFSIKLCYRKTGTGNLYLKFASSYVSKLGGTPIEDVDSYTVYSGGTISNDIGQITVPTIAYDALTAVVAGDMLSIACLRDATNILDTYTDDLDVTGFLIEYTVSAVVVYANAVDIITLAALKDYLGVTETKNDTLFTGWITDISNLIEARLGQQVMSRPIEELANGGGGTKLYLNQSRVLSLVGDDEATRLSNLQVRDSVSDDWENLVDDENLIWFNPRDAWAIYLLDHNFFTVGMKNIRILYNGGMSDALIAEFSKMAKEMIQVMWDESKAGGLPRLGMQTKNRGGAGSSLGDTFLDMNPRWQKTIDRYRKIL